MPTHGTCSRCGGPVQTPDLWGGTVPPTPTCSRCGAVASKPFGPVVPMDPAPHRPAPGSAADAEWLKHLGYTCKGYDVLTVSAGSPKPPAWVTDGER